MIGPPVVAIKAWIARAKVGRGPVFRAIDRWGTLEERALSPQSVNRIVKRRCVAAGFNPREFLAHGLRSGYLIEAARQGVSLPEAMHQSQHRSVQQAVGYYKRRGSDKGLGRASGGMNGEFRGHHSRGPRVSRG
jgi:integrase